MKVFPVLVVAVALVMSVTDAYPLGMPGTIPVAMDTALFAGHQEGNAQTKAKSVSDSRGQSNAEMNAGLLDSGNIRGLVVAVDGDGTAASGQYNGLLDADGGLWSNTNALAGDYGAVAQTKMEGYMTGHGDISGGVGAGAGPQY
ncbi:uncharacterized protein [Panulirus ornatus]|uniref:uncharacterized protein isoform X2 n=1 Tax=Panulirus ornatus TaxID=150431 RepID=UPI003A83CFC1